ncbi:MAG: sugar ABC transporter ATP-binding protein [Phycisphaera sp.]|nr:sugar ABC transporter ATP-binding protein [Phycisphaera sp.]
MLKIENISKTFPAVRALNGVTLRVDAGEVHGVIGENGAGKSTLMKILAGVQPPDEGSLSLAGSAYRPRHVNDASEAGVVMIHQELNLVDDLSVAENIMLGREPRRLGVLDFGTMRKESARILTEIGATIDPRTRVGDLPVAQQQLVEIAKALSQDTRVLILDEPTAVLSERETTLLFRLVRRLRERGVAIVYISHLLPEILDLCDRITVLRDGRLVAETTPADSDADHLASLMVGRELVDVYPPRVPIESDSKRLDVRGLTVPGHAVDVDFDIAPGEILGLAGLVGSGRTEVAEAIVGLRPVASGEIRLDDQPVRFQSPRQALDRGVAYVSEDRKGRGILVDLSCVENTTLPNLSAYGRVVPHRRRERAATDAWIERLDIRCPDPRNPIRSLSGGNQQKFAVASRLDAEPTVILLDEPTRGVDVGAKRELYHLIAGLADRGLACLMISSELPELIGLCHRIAVMRQGRLAGVVDGPTATEESIMRLAAGVEDHAA